jgi:hypothetical protein
MGTLEKRKGPRMQYQLIKSFLLLCLAFSSIAVTAAENLFPGDSSFESGRGDMITGSFNGKITCTIKCDDAAHGKSCAELNFISRDRTKSKPIPISSAQNGKIFTFSVYAKSNEEGLKGRVCMIQTDWSNTLHGKFQPIGKKWKRYSITGRLKKGNYWLCLETDKPGTVFIDAFQVIEGKKASEYRNKEGIYLGISIPGNNSYVFFQNQKIPVSAFVTVEGKNDAINGATLNLRISDHNKTTVMQKEYPVIMKDGIFKAEVEFIPPRLGWFKITAKLQKDKKIISESIAAFSSVKPPSEIKKGRLPFCGTDGAQFPGLKRIGASRWVQKLLYWKCVESVKGKYKWPDLKWIHDSGRKCKLTLGHMPSAPKWTWNPEELKECRKMKAKLHNSGLLPDRKYLDDWREFIRQTVMRYKDQIDIIEIGAEDDLTFGGNPYYLKKYPNNTYKGKIVSGPAYERYLELLKSACEEIRKIKPDLKIGIVRPSNVDCYHYKFSTPAIEACGSLFDLFPLDCYPNGPRYIGPGRPETPLPEDFLADSLTRARKICKTKGNSQNVYISEFGYALDYTVEPDSSYSMEMAKRLARAYLIARTTPGVELFQWFITGDNCIEAGKYHYGLWRFGMPMPTVPAYSAVAEIVENTDSFKELATGGDSRAVVFQKENQADAALWFVRGSGKLKFNELDDRISVTDFMGNPAPLKKIMTVNEFPLYFRMKGSDSFKALSKALSDARMICRPLDIFFFTPEISKGKLRIKNIAGSDINAQLSISGGKSEIKKLVQLKKEEETNIEVPLNEISAPLKIAADCGKEYEKIEKIYTPEFESCAKIKFPGKIDGNVEKWRTHPFITMDKRGQIMPPDPWIEWEGPEQFSAKIYTGWDDEYFYMAAEVRDNIHSNNFPRLIYKGDCMQFAFDPKADAEKPGYAEDDKELGIALADGKTITAKWAGKENIWKNSEAIVKRNEATKSTFYELRIPLESLGISPVKGTVFGFNFIIFNDDNGAGANYYYQLSPGITGGKNPAQFKKFVLAP